MSSPASDKIKIRVRSSSRNNVMIRTKSWTDLEEKDRPAAVVDVDEVSDTKRRKSQILNTIPLLDESSMADHEELGPRILKTLSNQNLLEMYNSEAEKERREESTDESSTSPSTDDESNVGLMLDESLASVVEVRSAEEVKSEEAKEEPATEKEEASKNETYSAIVSTKMMGIMSWTMEPAIYQPVLGGVALTLLAVSIRAWRGRYNTTSF